MSGYTTFRSKHGLLHLTTPATYDANRLALCSAWIGEAYGEGEFNEVDCDGLCGICLHKYLRAEGLRLAAVVTTNEAQEGE